jgi:hypothetical protein
MTLDLAKGFPMLAPLAAPGRLLGKTLLLLGLGLLGWALVTAWFAWQHRGPVSAQELIPDGEAAMTQDIIQTAVRIVDQHRDNTRYLRDAHAKAHGCVQAEVKVLPDLANALRQGVFSEPGKTWQRRCACPTAMPTRSSTASAMPGAWRSSCSMCRANSC